MMRSDLVLDATRLVRRTLEGRTPTGIDRTSLAYMDRYRSSAQAMVTWGLWTFLLPRGASRRLWDALLNPGVDARRRIRWALLSGAVASVALPRGLAPQILFNTGHTGLDRPGYRAVIRRLRFRPVFLIHDLIPITHPEYCRPGEGKRHAARIKTALECGGALIVNSKATLEQLTQHAGRTRTALPATVLAPLAPGLKRQAPGERPIAAPYFVTLGTIEPRKNHWMLLQIWRQLVERLGSAAPKLVIVGQRGWECENVVDLLERCEPLRDFVIEHSTCTDPELNNYLYHARALLFPSFAEGYGMPLIEALALGVPAVVSDLPVFREVGGEIPEYVDPLDGKRWSDVVVDLAGPDSKIRARQLERMRGFAEPTWSQHFAIIDALIARLNAPA